jgi:hypothetical protein
MGPAASALAAPYPTLHRGVRPLGMGGAFTALADDENALFYNPAGLSAIQQLDLAVLNPLVDVSKKSIDLFEDAQDIDTDDVGQVSDLMRQYIGEHQHLQASFFPYAGFRVASTGVMIGGLAQAVADAEIRNPAWPEAQVDYVQDLGLLAGFGLRLPIAGLKMGAAAKYISRKSLDEVYTASDIADDSFGDRFDDDQKSGSGLSLDLGAIYTLPFISFVKTDIALAVLNLPEMDMGDAKDLKTQANIGIAMEKMLAKFRLVGTLDYLDLTQALEEDKDLGKRLHMGIELKTPWFVAIRGGINQGYFTAGATVDFRLLRLDFATYTEEVGSYAGQRGDQRYVGQFTIGW